jgi:hypothetical protein
MKFSLGSTLMKGDSLTDTQVLDQQGSELQVETLDDDVINDDEANGDKDNEPVMVVFARIQFQIFLDQPLTLSGQSTKAA